MSQLIELKRGVVEVIVTSLMEVYPKEAVGLIFGSKTPSGYRCDVSIPLQEAERDVFGVSWRLLYQERVKKAIFYTFGYKFLGIYHSHTDAPATLSEEDISLLRERNYPLCLVGEISKVGCKRPYWLEAKLGIQGNIQNFKVVINAFTINANGIEQAKVKFPFMKVYNILAEKFGISFYNIINLPDNELQKVQYSFQKMDYHLGRGGNGYRQQKITYALKNIERILRENVGLLGL